ncbi:MAG: riboflavin synthase [Chloroflexi bacterium]|nr:riboflavin synthase [Chloroflexota bacterium]
MFTGIVEERGRVIAAGEGRLVVGASLALEGTRVGDSLSVNGACLTVAEMGEGRCAFDIMPETLRRTNLGLLRPESPVNLERALTFNGRIGGHLVQGHVDGTGRVLSVTPEGDARLVCFSAPPSLVRYIVEKGFIAVNGVSLTVVRVEGASFTVSLVRYTLEHTDLGEVHAGDTVNLEVDIMAKYAERLLTGEQRPEGQR